MKVIMASNNDMEKALWAAADQLWANSSLRPAEYSGPVLGLIFLRYADQRFSEMQKEFVAKGISGRRQIGATDYQAKGVLYLPEQSRFSTLKNLPEGEDIGKSINDAMGAIEEANPYLKGTLPRTYQRIDNPTLIEIMRVLGGIPMDIEGDVFGKIYEYFLGKFAMKEGQKGGEFFTPASIVKLIVEIIEPYHGKILDPACGSGGMFVQSAKFIQRHRENPSDEISIHGQERVENTIRLCQMNMAVNGLEGTILQGNTYYEDRHESIGKFDFVMANPPFNVSGVDKERIKDDPRFSLGIPTTDNANYLWIQVFYSALNETGRAGFVMANSAADARGTEQSVRQKLIESKAIDVMVSIGSNFFYTVTLPCMLWFLDKGKKNTDREDTVLFIDARQIYHQVDRAHRDFTKQQLEFLSNIVRLYRGETPENNYGSAAMLMEQFPEGKYIDVSGLCKTATIQDIEAQGWSLNPGRYVGVSNGDEEDFDFKERLEELNEELESLNAEGKELESRISENTKKLLGLS
jgi:type I restriction enzyme M protein